MSELRHKPSRSFSPRLENDIEGLSNSPGVYLFYGHQDSIPLYIGKSVRVRQRVLSYFHVEDKESKIFRLAQQIERISWIPTAGELSALLLESELIKQFMPIYNRRLRRQKSMVGFQLVERDGYLHIEIIRSLNHLNPLIYGAYRSEWVAKNALTDLVREYGLCPKLCQLESSRHACFSYQLKRCLGACIKQEEPESYNIRVKEALDFLKIDTWPFPGKIVIKETHALNQLTQYLVFDQWRHIGTTNQKKALARDFNTQGSDNWDTYRILRSYLKQMISIEEGLKNENRQIIELV